jgi:gamma-glutamyl hercynylcysteine S-oxide synthase
MIAGENGGYAQPSMAIAAPSELSDALRDARARTLALVAPLGSDELARVQHPLMSPLDWDLGHIAAYEDLWIVHRHGGGELLRPDLADLYDAFETPRAVRGDIPFLRGQDVFDYIGAVRERALEVLHHVGAGDGTLFELVVRHEAQHNETMRQTLFLAGLPGGRPDAAAPSRAARAGAEEDWIDVPGGPFQMGAGPAGFAFDNERPRHRVDVAPFAIARRPVTNGTWLRFCEGGGYERREWWSDEGWAWKEEYDITHPEGSTAGGPIREDQPVMHVSWFEADAFARSQGARLPTEAEWEKASTWTQEPLAQVGEVWEWTASPFIGYPGFVAHPYREYSEVFFGERYRVLRGCSWATEQRVRAPTFRNWDLPQRRQIFAGVRLAKDVT